MFEILTGGEMDISVVIPVYNAQDTIGELVERLAKVLPGVSDTYETVLVCDGSPDDSWKVIEGLAAVMIVQDDGMFAVHGPE